MSNRFVNVRPTLRNFEWAATEEGGAREEGRAIIERRGRFAGTIKERMQTPVYHEGDLTLETAFKCLEDKFGWTALMHAAQGGHKDCLRILLLAGAKVQNESKDTALEIAKRFSHEDCIKILQKY